MPTNTLSILKPSVNNLTTRIFIRAAGLDFDEIDVWGKKSEPGFMAKDPAALTPLLEEEGLPRGALWESCAIMQYLCNKHGFDDLYPTDPGERCSRARRIPPSASPSTRVRSARPRPTTS